MQVASFSHRNTYIDMPITMVPVNVCNMDYLDRITRGDRKSADKLVAIFFEEISEALASLQLAIEKTNFPDISNISHKMKSAFAILGVASLEPVIKELEDLSIQSSSMEKIKLLSEKINIVFTQVMIEMKVSA